jgi:putative phosphoesterase
MSASRRHVEAIEWSRELRGSDLIIHAGDVGKPEIIEQLRALAPAVAVRGNIDKGPWASYLPLTAVAEAGSVLIYVLHDIAQLDLDPVAAQFNVVISGHSHKPDRTERNGVMYLNPGSAGPRRFQLPIMVARLDLRTLPWKGGVYRPVPMKKAGNLIGRRQRDHAPSSLVSFLDATPNTDGIERRGNF